MAPPDTRSATTASPRPPWILLGLAALAAAFVGFGRLLPGYFVGDDFAFVGRYASFPFSEWPRLFTRSWQSGLFSVDLREIRPLNALAFVLDGRLWGGAPFGYRLTNLLLHAGSAVLVGALAWELSRVRRVAIFATLLFALHPVAVPAVGWITGRVDVLSTLFLLGAALALVRNRRRTDAANGALAASALSFAAALFTKESALVFPGLMLVLDYALGTRWRDARTWRPYAAAAAVLALYAAFRFAAFGLAGPTGIGRGLAATDESGWWSELLTRQLRYAAHLAAPAADWLAQWRDAGFALRGAVFLRIAALSAALAIGALAVLRWIRTASSESRRRAVALGLGWYQCTTLPLMLTYFSARHLYPALAGLALAAAFLIHEILPQPRRFAFAAGAALLVLAALQQTAVSRWTHAAAVSRSLHQATQATVRDVAPSTIVLLDAPDLLDGAFCWSWAVPHALRPPFTAEPLDARVTLIARPSACAYREDWRARLPRQRFAENQQDARLLRVRADGTVIVEVIPAENVRRAGAWLMTKPRLDADALWARLVENLTVQSVP